MSRQLASRIVLGAIGVATAAWGAWTLLTDSRLDQLVNAALWLGGGIATHDALIAPATLLLAWLLVRRLPGWARGAAVAGFIVLGSLTLVSIPVLGAWGRRPDNPTLLPRDYWQGWLIVMAVIVSASVAAALRARAHDRIPTHGAEHPDETHGK